MSRITAVTVSMPERHELLTEAAASLRAQTVGPVPWLLRIEEPDTFGARHIARQRNAILAAVETEWIAVLDDDDLLDANYLEVMSAHLDTADVVYSYCRARGHIQSEWDPDRLRRENYIDGESLIRTEALRAVGGYPESDVADDYMLWLRLLDAGARFVCVPQELRDHRKGGWRRATP